MNRGISQFNKFTIGIQGIQSLNLSTLNITNSGTAMQVFNGSSSVPYMKIQPTGITVVDLTTTGTLTTNVVVVNTYSAGLIHLANTNPSDVLDIGFYGQYINGTTYYTGLARDTSDTSKCWTFFNNFTSAPTTTINSGTPIPTGNLDNIRARTLRIIGGTVGNPSLTFESALSTGIYSSGSNYLGITLNGVDYFNFQSSVITSVSRFYVSNTTESTSSSSNASIRSDGGLSIAKTIYAGINIFSPLINVSGTITTNILTSTTLSAVTGVITNLTASAFIASGTSTLNVINVSGISTFSNHIVMSDSTKSATLYNAILGNPTSITGTLAISGISTISNTLNMTVGTTINASNIILAGTLTANLGSTVNLNGTVNIASANFGAYVQAQQVFASNSTAVVSAVDATAPLRSAGGLAVGANAYFGTDVYVGGNFTVVGIVSLNNLNLSTTTIATTSFGLTNETLVECTFNGTISIFLPIFGTTYRGKQYIIIKMNAAGALSIYPNGGDLINGVNASYSAMTQFTIIRIIGGQTMWLLT